MFEALAPNEMGAGNSTHAIHRAGRSGDLVVVRRYLKKPAILNRRDDEQMTCLHWYVHRSTRTSRIVLDFEALLGLASWASDKAVHCMYMRIRNRQLWLHHQHTSRCCCSCST